MVFMNFYKICMNFYEMFTNFYDFLQNVYDILRAAAAPNATGSMDINIYMLPNTETELKRVRVVKKQGSVYITSHLLRKP
jgi:hypothetical protein